MYLQPHLIALLDVSHSNSAIVIIAFRNYKFQPNISNKRDEFIILCDEYNKNTAIEYSV